MAWRVVEFGDTQWIVSAAVERHAHNAYYRLILSFRSAGPDGVSVWAPYPQESDSKSCLFAEADRLVMGLEFRFPDKTLRFAWADTLAQARAVLAAEGDDSLS